MVAAMNSVGVDGAIMVSSFSAYEYDPSYALEVYNTYPDKFRVVTPVDATNPAIYDVVAKWAATPGARGIRIRMRDGLPMDADYAYYIYGVGHHTEDDCRTEDSFMQVYRPLYENSYAYRNGGLFDLRPLYMFYKPAIREGREVPRFTQITDAAVIAELQAIKTRMYGDL